MRPKDVGILSLIGFFLGMFCFLMGIILNPDFETWEKFAWSGGLCLLVSAIIFIVWLVLSLEEEEETN